MNHPITIGWIERVAMAIVAAILGGGLVMTVSGLALYGERKPPVVGLFEDDGGTVMSGAPIATCDSLDADACWRESLPKCADDEGAILLPHSHWQCAKIGDAALH